jgi:hypothetical protein
MTAFSKKATFEHKSEKTLKQQLHEQLAPVPLHIALFDVLIR